MPTQSEQAFLAILNLLTVDELKPRFRSCLAAGTAPARKAELARAMKAWLAGNGLELVWQSLTELEQQAVRTSLYCNDGWFDERRFAAEFGAVPAWFTERYYHFNTPAERYRLGCFFYPPGHRQSGQRIPDWLQERLTTLVSPPLPVQLPAANLPDPLPGKAVVVAREQVAARELRLMLAWLQEGRLRVSGKTGLPGKALLKQVSALLAEYYTGDCDEDASGVEHIKAFGWIMVLQASRWVECRAGRLTLTPAGQQQLSAPLHRTLRTLWQDWLDNTLLDEFSRIEIIRGQTGKGVQSLTPAADRRHAIAAALTESPVGGWVSYPAFSRFMLTAGHEFEITGDVSTLYLCERYYGTLRYPQWEVLQGRYLRCLLLEYAATLGLVDLVLAPPQQPEPDYDYMWGADDVCCLSRYDGLLYLRLTALGAFCLGLTGDYQDVSARRPTPLALHKGGRLVFSQPPTEAELLLIEAHAAQHGVDGWRLCREKMLTLLENGGSLAPLRAFMTERDPQPFLPDDVERLLTECEANARAVTPAGRVLLLHCRDAATAAAIAAHPQTAGLCQAAGDHRLLVEPEREAAFRQALHRAGFGMVAT